MTTRVLIAVLLLALVGCREASGDRSAPVDEQAAVDAAFADKVQSMTEGMSDEAAVDAAKGACFELVRMVERPRDLNLFIRLFAAREVVASEHVIPFLVVSMKTYCPEMEQFRPGRSA